MLSSVTCTIETSPTGASFLPGGALLSYCTTDNGLVSLYHELCEDVYRGYESLFIIFLSVDACKVVRNHMDNYELKDKGFMAGISLSDRIVSWDLGC